MPEQVGGIVGIRTVLPEIGGGGRILAGAGGRFADLAGPVGDGLTAHHIPQAALNFTSRGGGGAIVMPQAEHAATRTYGFLGRQTAAAEERGSFRAVLARDIRDMRSIVGARYNELLSDVIRHYKRAFPDLIEK